MLPALQIANALRRLSPLAILALGWAGFLVYAFPGFMSFDSVYQLREARSGYLSDGHPPAMAELWRIVECFIAGPFGMLVIQTVAFLAGAYLLCARRMRPRIAAVVAVLLLAFPPIASVMAVIWKDAQMTGFLVLGLGLVASERRATRLWGLAVFLMATLMRHNALVMTGPLILFGFVWEPAWRWWRRYAVAIAAWVVITLAAQAITGWLTDTQKYIWTDSLALCDIAATLRYVEPTISDDELRRELAGIRIIPERDLHAFARRSPADQGYIDTLWSTAYGMFAIPATQAERDAVWRAWKAIVLDHPHAYLEYRKQVFARVLGLVDTPPDRILIYDWYVDVQNPSRSAGLAEHDASPSKLGAYVRAAMEALGRTPLFELSLYVILVVVMVPFALRDREAFGLLASAVTNELALFPFAPTPDWRYSFWLVVATVLAIVLIVARRAHGKSSGPANAATLA